jgi:hypothetical protein
MAGWLARDDGAVCACERPTRGRVVVCVRLRQYKRYRNSLSSDKCRVVCAMLVRAWLSRCVRMW